MILVISGFAILLVNANDYLGGFFGLSSDIKLPSSGIGVVFLVAGWIQILYTHKEAWRALALIYNSELPLASRTNSQLIISH